MLLTCYLHVIYMLHPPSLQASVGAHEAQPAAVALSDALRHVLRQRHPDASVPRPQAARQRHGQRPLEALSDGPGEVLVTPKGPTYDRDQSVMIGTYSDIHIYTYLYIYSVSIYK